MVNIFKVILVMFLSLLVGTLIPYLFIAFYQAEFNAFVWQPINRELLIVLSVIFSVVLFVMFYSIVEEGD